MLIKFVMTSSKFKQARPIISKVNILGMKLIILMALVTGLGARDSPLFCDQLTNCESCQASIWGCIWIHSSNTCQLKMGVERIFENFVGNYIFLLLGEFTLRNLQFCTPILTVVMLFSETRMYIV